MSRNRKYKLKYDALLDNDPTKKDSDTVAENGTHDTPSPSRTICFVWPDGRQQFFSYAYLISGELNVADDANLITLRFTSDVVTLRGFGLTDLFEQLVRQAPSHIVQTDPRYGTEDETFSITEIIVTPII